jgi:hypothetical protein
VIRVTVFSWCYKERKKRKRKKKGQEKRKNGIMAEK